MRSGQLEVSAWGRRVLVLGVLLAMPQAVEAQGGISSGIAQVALVARALPSGSVRSVSGERVTGRIGSLRESAVTLETTSNNGYSLVVRGAAQLGAASVWVRALDGQFQELKSGASVTVAQELHGAGHLERQVQYRIDSSVGNGSAALPVYYELRINPTI